MTHLTHDIYGIVVPKKAKTPRCLFGDLAYNLSGKIITTDVCILNYKILGTASPIEFTFDCEDFIDKKNGEYRDHTIFSLKWYTKNIRKEKSFLSLIESKGIILQPNEKLLILRKL